MIREIAIIGGSGFVGAAIAQRLVKRGQRVRVISRRRERQRALLVLPTLQSIECNPYDTAALANAIRGCDAVINLVGILNERGDDGRGFQRAHVELPQSVVSACQQAGLQRLLHMSALGASASAASYYLKSKAAGEALVMASGLQVTAFRPSVIFGPGDSFLNRFAALLKMVPGVMPLAAAKSQFAPVYVGDVAECFIRALDLPATIGQSYELCGPHRYTLEQLVSYTASQIGRTVRIIPLGATLSRWQANIFEHLPGKPLSRDNYRSLQHPSLCNGPFPSLFGITPTPLEAIAPAYLNCGHAYDRLRQQARREG
jgi:uncharacterized protein YbjT (DUF2867 family)